MCHSPPSVTMITLIGLMISPGFSGSDGWADRSSRFMYSFKMRSRRAPVLHVSWTYLGHLLFVSLGARPGRKNKERLTAQIPSVPDPQTNLRRPFASVISLQLSNIKSSPHLELLAYSFRIEEIDIHPVFIVFCRHFRYANDHVHHLVPLIACHRRRIVD